MYTNDLNIFRQTQTDFKDPPNLRSSQKHIIENVKGGVYEVLKELDPETGMIDGYSYNSYKRLTATKLKHLRKPVGPIDYFRRPITTNMDYGFWTGDPTLKDLSWCRPAKPNHRMDSDMTKYYDKASKIDKCFRLPTK